ncbi:hypothetical protein [uncultured Metabacillus sp.]|uniref:hypothetical protein n=1 Tax=uncultured Metabacillus sp. TaxID=2860135 RepID=UPI002628CE08|nr:hypothetical protein [uncultured Metabacillus sp.]
MKYNLQEQIERINNIDKNEKSIILIKAMDSILSIDHVVDIVITKYKNEVFGKQIKNIGLGIIDEFRKCNNYIFFEKEFKKICGFHEDDKVSGEIIFKNFSENKDIENLKKELIDLAKSLD